MKIYNGNELIDAPEGFEAFLVTEFVEPVPAAISDRQFFQQLAIDGEVTQAEALAAVATGTVPQALADVITQLPEASQFAANMFLQGATTFERNHVMTLTLAALMGWDAPMLDRLWTNAALL